MELRKPKINDKLTSIWGYDQTNVDIYEVIKVTEKTITVKRITSPQETITRKIKYSSNNYYITLNSYSRARYDENPNETFKQDASMTGQYH
jgi:hypothetical protein